jgi:hypothetical protein
MSFSRSIGDAQPGLFWRKTGSCKVNKYLLSELNSVPFPRSNLDFIDLERSKLRFSINPEAVLDGKLSIFYECSFWQTRAWNLLRSPADRRLITCVVSSEYIFCSKFLMHDSIKNGWVDIRVRQRTRISAQVKNNCIFSWRLIYWDISWYLDQLN